MYKKNFYYWIKQKSFSKWEPAVYATNGVWWITGWDHSFKTGELYAIHPTELQPPS